MEPKKDRTFLTIALIVAGVAVLSCLLLTCVIAAVSAALIAQRAAQPVQQFQITPLPKAERVPELQQAPTQAPTVEAAPTSIPETPEAAPAPTFAPAPTRLAPDQPPVRVTPVPPSGMGMGAYVREVVAGGPAEAAGLRVGDIILFVDDESLLLDKRLADVIASHKPGDTVLLGVVRAETPLTVEVTLGENPNNPALAYLGVRYVDLVNGDTPQQGD